MIGLSDGTQYQDWSDFYLNSTADNSNILPDQRPSQNVEDVRDKPAPEKALEGITRKSVPQMEQNLKNRIVDPIKNLLHLNENDNSVGLPEITVKPEDNFHDKYLNERSDVVEMGMNLKNRPALEEGLSGLADKLEEAHKSFYDKAVDMYHKGQDATNNYIRGEHNPGGLGEVSRSFDKTLDAYDKGIPASSEDMLKNILSEPQFGALKGLGDIISIIRGKGIPDRNRGPATITLPPGETKADNIKLARNDIPTKPPLQMDVLGTQMYGPDTGLYPGPGRIPSNENIPLSTRVENTLSERAQLGYAGIRKSLTPEQRRDFEEYQKLIVDQMKADPYAQSIRRQGVKNSLQTIEGGKTEE